MKKGFFALLLSAAFAASVNAQTTKTQTPASRAESYFHFSLAKIYDAQGQFQDSITEYKKALELDPNNSTIYSEMAETYWRGGQATNAVNTANEAVRINPDNIDAHTLLSQIYWKQLTDRNAQPDKQAQNALVERTIHEYEEIIRIDPSDSAFLPLGQLYQFLNQNDKAEEIYKRHMKVEPNSEEGVLALAELHSKSGDGKGAIAILEEFLKNRPDSDRAIKEMGDVYLDMQEYDKAANAYKKALDLGPEDDDELLGNYAQALFMGSRLDEAASVYQRILQRDPTDPATMVRLAQVYRRMGQYDKARVALAGADRLVPNNSEIQFNQFLVDREEGKLEDALQRLAALIKNSDRPNGRYTQADQQNRMIYFNNSALLNSSLGHYDQAVQAYQELRNISPDKDAVDVRIIETYRLAKNNEMANQYLQKALKATPNSRALMIVSADMVTEKGKVEEGIKSLEALAKDGKPDIELLAAMSDIYQRAKKWDDAQNVLERAAKAFPMESTVYFLYGAFYEKQKKDSEAEKAFRKSLDLDMDSAPALNYLGYMFADRGVKLDEALKMIQKAVDAEPTSGAYLDSLGWVYYKMNRLSEAEVYLKKAVLFASTDSTMHDHLGDLYNKTGRFVDAASEWQKAIMLSTEPKEADPIKKKLDQIKNKLPKKQL